MVAPGGCDKTEDETRKELLRQADERDRETLDREEYKLQCKNCIAYRRVKDKEYGECHFNPPVMYFDELASMRRTGFPEIHGSNWCLKFQGKKVH